MSNEPVAYRYGGCLFHDILDAKEFIRTSNDGYQIEPLYTHPVDDTALLRQALGALEYFLTYSEGKRDEETALAAITALSERLGERT